MDDKTHLGRPGYGVLSRSAELSNIQNTNGMLDALFSNRARIAAQTEQQVKPLYSNKKYYGRTLRTSMSKTRAIKK